MNRRLRILFFGSTGPLSLATLRALARDHDITAIVCRRARPPHSPRAWAGRLARALRVWPPDAATAAARECGAPMLHLKSSSELTRLSDDAPRADLVCVAAFPWKIPDEVLAGVSLGGINLHTSLLPRHRGPLTLFWVYHANDRETGVTVHRMTGTFDAGDVLHQQAFPLERGFPVDALYSRYIEVGPELMRQSAQALAAGRAACYPQDEQLVTYAPIVRPGNRMVDFDGWDAERVWHFLGGLYPRFIEPLSDVEGHAIRYVGVIGHERGTPRRPVGTVSRMDETRLALQCRDGVVYLRAGRFSAPTQAR